MVCLGVVSVPFIILLLLIIYRRKLHNQNITYIINQMRELDLIGDENVLIISLVYDDKYFKEVEQLLSKIKYKTVVLLKAPDWLIKIYSEKHSYHIVRGVKNASRVSCFFLYDGKTKRVGKIIFSFYFLYNNCISEAI